MAESILALDFGGTKLAAALAKKGERRFVRKAVASSPPQKGAAVDRKLMVSLAYEVMGDATPATVGVSFGGLVRPEGDVVVLSHHVPGWEGFPLKKWLEDRFGVPAVVENDANAGALGEWRFGAGRGCRSLLYVTVSTGVGSGWVLEGKVHRGADGLAGELGHMTMLPDGPLCACGRRGCLESLASGPAIARLAQERLSASGRESVLHETGGKDLVRVTAQAVAQAAEAGDVLAREVLTQAADVLGRAIARAILLMNPERVVLGGGVSRAGNHYLDQVRVAAQSGVPSGMRVDVVRSALEEEAPLLGAAFIAERLLTS